MSLEQWSQGRSSRVSRYVRSTLPSWLPPGMSFSRAISFRSFSLTSSDASSFPTRSSYSSASVRGASPPSSSWISFICSRSTYSFWFLFMWSLSFCWKSRRISPISISFVRAATRDSYSSSVVSHSRNLWHTVQSQGRSAAVRVSRRFTFRMRSSWSRYFSAN